MTDAGAIRLFARLRWRLLGNVLKTSGSQKWAIVLGLASALVAGMAGGVVMMAAGRTLDDPAPVFVIAAVGITMFVVVIGVVTGISQPVDPRVLATEPLTDRQLGLGLLAASAVGPPGLAAVLFGTGLFAGAVRGPASVIPVAIATVALLLTLLLISRSTINALGLLATRFPRAGQLVVGVTSLAFYAGLQLVSQLAPALGDEERRNTVADLAAWTPPGQLGRGIGVAADSPGRALLHVAAGSVWLLALVWVFVRTTRQLLVSSKRNDAKRTAGAGVGRRPIVGAIRRLCGPGPTGAVAWRGLLTRLRTPRTVLETFTGAGVGMAIVLVPALLRDQPGGGAVLVGGAVQFAVLFIAGNSFGSDGPALASELLAGVDPAVLVRAKARSVVVVAIPLAVVGPLIAAAVTGEWSYLPAGMLVGFGGLLAGSGGAIVQSTLIPIAIPDSDNPLASGDSGKGCLAGVMFASVLLSLALVTLPVAVLLLWAVGRDSAALTTLVAVGAIGAGAAVYSLGIRFAAGRWRRTEPELYAAIVPTR